jgi:hypothetical protein
MRWYSVSDYASKYREYEEELLRGYPDPGDLVRQSLSPEFSASMGQQTHAVLISCAAALTNFARFILVMGNKSRAAVTNLRRVLDSNKNKTIGGLTFNSRDTDKVKIAAAYKENPELGVLDSKLAVAEEKSIYYDKLSDMLLEHVNVIKYEIRRKELEATNKGRF